MHYHIFPATGPEVLHRKNAQFTEKTRRDAFLKKMAEFNKVS